MELLIESPGSRSTSDESRDYYPGDGDRPWGAT
jgi:hypothetical protein